MAKAYVVYKDEDGQYCFRCAVLRAIENSDLVDVPRPCMETSDYDMEKCDSCGWFIRDTITI